MLYISDLNVIKAIDFLKESGVIKFKKDCYKIIGVDPAKVHKMQFPEKYNIKQGHHFTTENIRILCESYGINANFIFGLEDEIILKKSNKKSNNSNKTD